MSLNLPLLLFSCVPPDVSNFPVRCLCRTVFLCLVQSHSLFLLRLFFMDLSYAIYFEQCFIRHCAVGSSISEDICLCILFSLAIYQCLFSTFFQTWSPYSIRSKITPVHMVFNASCPNPQVTLADLESANIKL